MKIQFIYFLILIFIGCKQSEVKESHCDKRKKDFIKDLSNKDIECLMGFMIETRGQLDNGEMYLRAGRIAYRPKDSSGDIVLPSFQITRTNKSYTLDTALSLRFVKELGIDTANHYQYTRDRIDCVRETFIELKIFGTMSQARLGEFIEFEIEHKCSVWYKKDGALLSPQFKLRFDNAIKLEENWYVLRNFIDTNVLDTIPDYIIENGDTIHLEYPSRFKDENQKK